MNTAHQGKGRFCQLLIAAAVFAFASYPGTGWAVTGDEICGGLGSLFSQNGDEDLDGFTNGEECYGKLPVLRFDATAVNTANPLCYPISAFVKDVSGTEIAGYLDKANVNSDRTKYLDPAQKDVFFTWTHVNTSHPFDFATLGATPFSYYNAGLGVTTHQIGLDNTCGKSQYGVETRYVTYHKPALTDGNAGQKAVSISESATMGIAMGGTAQGTPNDNGYSTIYTDKIWSVVDTNCNKGYTFKTKALCRTSTAAACTGACATPEKLPTAKDNLFIELTKYVINHELSHASNLAQPWSSTNEYHQAAESGVLMEKSLKLTTRSDIVFYLTNKFNSTDPAYTKLRGPADLH